MSMILAVFRKDAQRFWWEATVATALWAWLVRMDSARSSATPGSAEGWLNVLLPVAWSYLIALAVLEDAPAGARQFWMTLPVRWPALLAAKALLALAFVHLPFFLGQSVILVARGFSPVGNLPQLLWRQILLFVCLTLPSAALAAIVRDIVRFLLCALLIGAALAYEAGDNLPWLRADPVRIGMALLVIAAGTCAVAMLQYSRRRTTLSRLIVTLAVAAAAGLYETVPQQAIAKTRSVLWPAKSGVSLASANTAKQPPDFVARTFPPGTVTVPIPVATTGFDEFPGILYFAVEMETQDHRRYRAAWPWRSEPPTRSELSMSLWPPDWLVLALDRALFDSLRASTVTVRGILAVNRVRQTTPVSLPARTRAAVPPIGFCSSEILEPRFRYEDRMLKIDCESPRSIPFGVGVRVGRGSAPEWTLQLNDSRTDLRYPRETFLSPVDRADTFLHTTSDPKGNGWQAPVDALDHATISITPVEYAGSVFVRFELPNVALDRLAVQQRPR